jgi:hypothetical protein
MTPKAAGRQRTYQSYSEDLVATTRIKADIVFDKKLLRNKYLYVLPRKLTHDIVLGGQIWTALQPQTTNDVLAAPNSGQYLSEDSTLPQAFASMAIGDTSRPTTSSSYYQPPPQVAYTPISVYGNAAEQLTTDSKQIQPATAHFSSFNTEPSHQKVSSYTPSSGYSSTAAEDLNAQSTYSDYASEGNDYSYTSMPASKYDWGNVASTNSAPTTSAEASYVSPEYMYNAPSDESYIYQSYTTSYRASYQSPRLETQESRHTPASSETFYNQPEQVSRPGNHYAEVPEWKYDHQIRKS